MAHPHPTPSSSMPTAGTRAHPETWFLLQCGAADASFNMALDQVLLESANTHARPVLRFYAWSQPAASFGYFQRLHIVEQLTNLRPLVRRPTGGGLVPHDADWTYSLCFPANHPWHALRAIQSYQCVHAWLSAAFRQLHVQTCLASKTRREAPGQCFVGSEQNDLLWLGRKIAGAAQRRNRMGLLIQGSVQPPPLSITRLDWQLAMCDVAARQWSVRWEQLELNRSWINRAQDLALARSHAPRHRAHPTVVPSSNELLAL